MTAASRTVELRGSAATVAVSTTAAMVVGAQFRIGDRLVHPLARAPWLGELGLDGQPGHLRMLGGDFVGLPFGAAGAPDEVVSQWRDVIPAEAPVLPHGRSADADWEIVELRDDAVVLALEYPEGDDIARLERHIRVRQGEAALDSELVIHARRTTRVPVGLHPILRLPERPGDLRLDVAFGLGYTYPGRVYPGVGPTRAWSTFTDLAAVPARSGTVDLSRLPLAAPVEEIVLLTAVRGPVLAHFRDEDVTLTIDWDRGILPSTMLWISDRVLLEAPWNGRYRGIGVEAIASAFDFDPSVSVSLNPLSELGIETAVSVTAGSPVRIRSSLAVA